MEWCIPLLIFVKECNGSKRCVAERLGVSGSTLKSLVYAAKKLGLVYTERGILKLSKRAEEYLSAFEILAWEGRRMRVKGRDGCFYIIIRRKKGIKAIRVPCNSS